MYTVKSISESLKQILHKYLEADYHIWNESLIIARQHLLQSENLTSSDPRLEASPTFKSGVPFLKMELPPVASEFLNTLSMIKESGVYPEPRAHQRVALEKFLGDEKDIIVATGTGSGKTESFLYPILGNFALEGQRSKSQVEMPGCRVILLYPMNALVNDQLTRLRKMFGNKDVSSLIEKVRGRRATFAVYTSKTDYPGARNDKKDKKLIAKIKELYTGDALNKKDELWAEGLWPAKDMEGFINNSLNTSQLDTELYTRNEIQNTPPDILVTNYSMLEYMLARPIERDIFDKTSEWLNADPKNYLTIVLDEAHMYKGVVGSEVAFLLRRLQSRLHVNRDKIRYILTSASLGSEETDKQNVLRFAKELTGKNDNESSFELVTGIIEEKANQALPTLTQQNALSVFDMQKLHTISDDYDSAVKEVDSLFEKIGLGGFTDYPTNIVEFKDVVYKKLEVFPPAALLANKLTGKPTSYDSLMGEIFNKDINSNALESLIALCTFAQLRSTQQVFLPIRLHLMFRGVPGIFVCINPNCIHKYLPDVPSLVGKLYTYPALTCRCGGRVFEVLTHRDCGSAYIRGFINKNTSDFLLHEQTSNSSNERLIETHFLIEPSRTKSAKYTHNWIHIFSGRLYRHNPNSDDFLEVCVSDNQDVIIEGKQLWTFKSSCPVCSRKWKEGTTKIQDLTTKGEAPFSYLVRSQVVDQPALKKVDRKMPLGGRKTLVFSDGRQKAARLARDIPRNVEKDVYRVCLVLAIDYLEKNHHSNPSLKLELIYVAFLNVISDKNIILFDGDDRKQLINDLHKIDRYLSDGDTFQIMIDEDTWTPPEKFKEMFLVNLFSSYYSISALTIGSIYPSNRMLKKKLADFTSKFGFKSDNIAIEVVVNWLNKVIESPQFAFDKDISNGVRRSASGYDYPDSDFGIILGSRNSSFFNNLKFLDKSKHKELEVELISLFCDEVDSKYYINPSKVFVRLNLDNAWFQCDSCTKLSIVFIDNMCPYCGSNSVKELYPNQSEYLRARKSFYRDPVITALKDNSKVYNLCVEEHTAQLSYRDDADLVSTNESNERRFKDILVDKNEYPVDILSCTTTMEVGVDIGSLIAVSMRNVPPARQNYQQRAGRAGRRGAAISTVLTFAQTGSHDSYYFENPDKIISGNPIVPEIDISNEKVIKRHVIAAIIQSYFHRKKIDKKSDNNDLLSVLGLTKDFYVGTVGEFTLLSFENWLKSDFESSGVKAEITNWIPPSFNKKTIDQIKDDFIKELYEGKPEDLEKKDSYEDKFLNFLFSLGLLPSYAFPRHVCSFNIEEMASRYNIKTVESPQQNLSTALTEYAPGRLVVVNKKTYKIGSITARSANTEKNRAVALFDKKRRYLQCSNCLFTENFSEDSLNRKNCTHCGKDGIEILDVIQPEVVYPSGRSSINEFDDNDIYTSASAAQLPFMNDSQPSWEGFKKTAVIASEVDQLLVAINKGDDSSSEQSGFWICSLCGKASAEKDKQEKYHERDYFVYKESEKSKCSGEIVKVNIGYSFNSDVFILRLPLLEPMQQESIGIEKEGLITAARTLSESILQETSSYLEIDPAELNCGIRFLKINSVNHIDIFLYDTSSGGAGYASMAKEHFTTIFSNSIKRLKKNDCCDSSCYRCLQNYGNRWHHNFLNKKYGLMLWRKINEDVLPALYSSNEQLKIASSLNKLMALEGWSMSADETNTLLVRKGDKNIKFIIYPVLLDISYVDKEVGETVDCIISDYEIEKNLPGAYTKLISD